MGNSGAVGSLGRFISSRTQSTVSPINDKVCPEIAHHPGNLPVHRGEVEHPRREEVDELVSVGDSPGDGVPRDSPREQEVPQGRIPVVLERVEVRVAATKVVKLHELVGGGLDEEGTDHLEQIG